ncbi:flagellar assembly protein A [Clostridium uliginosum]|uniref:RNA-binding protein KhpB N-terminal domain-containing protein n=1 Tax=Clostridium uliginosum TaxID=119641 RepID=A0A1I1KHN4_9CLOT|nr:flagellar assembly protein A [Clostridium uliginosum]SFC60161.1 hypothetical protein SAMN05421842_1068 [Clostridium uliginosum]
MSLLFSATTLDKCLEKASSELQVSKECLKYTIIERKNTFFRKQVKIEVSQCDVINKSIDTIVTEKNTDEMQETIENDICTNTIDIKEEKLQSGIKVQNGEIIISDCDYVNNNYVTLESCFGITLFVNEQECKGTVVVRGIDNIESKSIKEEATRKVHISTSEDGMEAYIIIQYTPEYHYELKDKPCCDNLVLEAKKVAGKYPPKYTLGELQLLLKDNKIVHGIIKENLEEVCAKNNEEKVLIAKGDSVVEDIPDTINVFFETNKKRILKDDDEKIDYRNMYSISTIKINEVLAEKITGKDGKDGKDIFGKEIHRIHAKKIPIKTGEGCILRENKILATIEGRPSSKAGVFCVNKIYSIDDVDIKSGNIHFIGDVEINGSVKSGTEVKVGNSVIVKHNVEDANVIAGGQVTILANALNSTITSGAEDINKKKYLEILKQYDNTIEELIDSVKQIKDKKLLGVKKTDGEVIKLLIENKFKSIPRLSMLIISHNLSNGISENEILYFIRDKLLGLGPIKIKSFFELHDFQQLIKKEMNTLGEETTIPTDIYVSYSQDSKINASGNVFITGKGQYVSQVTALNNIEFTQSGAVSRGGILCAGNEIKVRTVGSIAGVVTRLEVSKKGIITADVAYQNTTFCFGEKQVVLDVASRDVKAYLGKDGMITIDKFLL